MRIGKGRFDDASLVGFHLCSYNNEQGDLKKWQVGCRCSSTYQSGDAFRWLCRVRHRKWWKLTEKN